MIERLLAMLIADLGDPSAVEQVDQGSWKIYLDNDIDIQLTYEQGLICWSALVGPIIKRRDLLEDILSGNCLGQGTFGNCLCTSDGESLYIKRQNTDAISYRDFFCNLENMFNSALFWRKRTSPKQVS